jgi:DNA polymerase-3 subunit delta'
MNVDQAYEYIKHSADAGRMAQAYVVSAPPRGAGRDLVGRMLRLLLPDEHACTQAMAGKYPDVHWIEPEKKSRIISVDSMRAVMKKVHETAFGGGWKICIFVGADRMNMQAANAFLKTLEEPPAKTLFMLLTDSPQGLLPTIISRCQQVAIAEASSDGLSEELREDLAGIMANLSGSGGVEGLALANMLTSFLKEIKSDIEQEEKELWKDERVVRGMDEREAKKKDDALDARINARYRETRQAVMRSILLWYRDILMLVCGSDESLVYHQPQLELLRERAGEQTYRDALAMVGKVEGMHRLLESNLQELQVFASVFGGW